MKTIDTIANAMKESYSLHALKTGLGMFFSNSPNMVVNQIVLLGTIGLSLKGLEGLTSRLDGTNSFYEHLHDIAIPIWETGKYTIFSKYVTNLMQGSYKE